MKKQSVLLLVFLLLTAVAVANDNNEKDETVDPHFNVEIIDDNSPVFIGETLEIGFKVWNVGGDGEEKVTAHFDNEEIRSQEIFLEEEEEKRITVEHSTSSDDRGKEIPFEIEVDNKNFQNRSRDEIKVDVLKEPEFSIEDLEIIPETAYNTEEEDVSEVFVTFEVKNEGDVEGEVEIKLKKGLETIEEKTENISGGETEEFVFKIEEEEIGTHEISIDVGDDSATEEFTVEEAILFEGYLKDAEGQPFEGEIILEHDKGGRYSTETSDDGEYSLRIRPGTYDVSFGTPYKPEINLYDVELYEEDSVVAGNDPLRLDFFKPEGTIGGIQPLNTYVITTGLDFGYAEIYLRYNDTDVRGSQSDLEMYECREWNYGRRECVDQWENRSIDINTGSNLVSFETENLTSFTLGSSGEMILDTNIPSEVEAKQDFEVYGTVEDDRGNAIESSRINYVFEEEESHTFSDSSGSFEIDLTAPREEGDYNFEIYAEKDSFKSNTTSSEINVERVEELSVSQPNDIEVSVGNSSEFDLQVENDGRVTISSIDVSVEGIPEDWYSLSPSELINLAPDSTTETIVEINIPEECKEDCELGHFVDVIVDTGETVEEVSFELEIDDSDVETGFTPTAYVAATPSKVAEGVKSVVGAINPIILSGFVVLILLVGAATVKKRRKYGSGNSGAMSTGTSVYYHKNKEKNKSKTLFDNNSGGGKSVFDKIRDTLPDKKRDENDSDYDFLNSKSFKKSRKKSKKEMPRESIVPIFNNVKEDLND